MSDIGFHDLLVLQGVWFGGRALIGPGIAGLEGMLGIHRRRERCLRDEEEALVFIKICLDLKNRQEDD